MLLVDVPWQTAQKDFARVERIFRVGLWRQSTGPHLVATTCNIISIIKIAVGRLVLLVHQIIGDYTRLRNVIDAVGERAHIA